MIRKKEALPDLPDKVYDYEEAGMTPKQSEVYEAVATEMVAEIESMLDGENKSLVINNILTKLLRLAQICSGFITYPEERDPDGNIIQERSTEMFSPIPKLERLYEIVKTHLNENENSKIIIWACWVNDLEAIIHKLSELTNVVGFYGGTSEKERQENEYLFNNDPNTRVFVGNPSAGGTGLNLLGYPPGQEDHPTNCDRVIYYSQDWSMVNRSQSEDRAHRRGTRQNVRVTDLMVPNTIDEEIRSRVLNKRMNALEIADIRNILSTLTTGVLTS
jgi:SNF2 family DNA or RNA helicase